MFRGIMLRLVLVVVAMSGAMADTILLSNGDRITGTILSVDGGVVRVATPYAGDIAIQLEAVSGMETEEPRAVALSDDSLVEGILTQRDGKTGVRTGDAFHPAAPTDMIALASDAESLDALLHPPPPSKWSGAVDAGLALRSGNTDTTDIKFNAGVKRTGERDTLALNFAAAYGSADEVLNTRRFQGDFRWQYYLRERLYLYTMGLAERDDGRKLDYRLQGGGGIGYDFLKSEKRSLSADLGATYTYERWSPFTPWERTRVRDTARFSAYNQFYAALMNAGNGGRTARDVLGELRNILADMRDPLRSYRKRTEDYVNLRVGVNYSQPIFKTSVLTEELVLMPNMENLGEFRALSELALSTPLTEALSLRTSLKTEYDSLADKRGVEPWDNTLMTQFRYKF